MGIERERKEKGEREKEGEKKGGSERERGERYRVLKSQITVCCTWLNETEVNLSASKLELCFLLKK